MSPNSSEIYSHALLSPNGKEIIAQALSLLRPHFPTSLPLYRRLQTGRFFPATILLTNLPSLSADPSVPSPSWLIAFVDRTCRPETEVYLFGSWESLSEKDYHQEENRQLISNLLKSLVQTIKSFPLPTSMHQDVLDALATTSSSTSVQPDSSGLSRSDYTSHMSNPSLVLFGAVHARTAHLLNSAGMLGNVSPGVVGMVPNSTFIFNLDDNSVPRTYASLLPDGLEWGKLEYADFALVRARTQIPRQDRTLAGLRGVAILDVGRAEEGGGAGDAKGRRRRRPVGWVFVGLDGSLTTLHVEEEWRGRGLAKALTVKLLREEMEGLWEVGVERLGHGYVVEGNRASEGLCASLGGRKVWDAFWLRVDLEAGEL